LTAVVINLFQVLGVLVLCYVGQSYLTGQVYAKHGVWGRTIRRDSDPWNYWFTLAIYTILAIAMFFFFGRRSSGT
jgi:Mn2+/Fe2+ NRAMP family transporter